MAMLAGRSLHGERGLKQPRNASRKNSPGRSLHGERGLKPTLLFTVAKVPASLPSRGARIETYDTA